MNTEQRKQYYLKNRDILLSKAKTQYQNKKQEKIQYQREYYNKHKEERREYSKNYQINNKEKYKVYQNKWKEEHKEYREKYDKERYELNKEQEKLRKREYLKTPEGKLNAQKRQSKRRGFKSEFLNDCFENSIGHHLDKKNIIHIPEELHKSIWHSVLKDIRMTEINIHAWDFMESNSY